MPGHRNVRKICFARSSIMGLPERTLWCADAKDELSRAVVLCVAEWLKVKAHPSVSFEKLWRGWKMQMVKAPFCCRSAASVGSSK